MRLQRVTCCARLRPTRYVQVCIARPAWLHGLKLGSRSQPDDLCRKFLFLGYAVTHFLLMRLAHLEAKKSCQELYLRAKSSCVFDQVTLCGQATMDWEAQDEGFLAKIILPAGSKDIPVGTPVAVVVEDAEHVRSRTRSEPACMRMSCRVQGTPHQAAS